MKTEIPTIDNESQTIRDAVPVFPDRPRSHERLPVARPGAGRPLAHGSNATTRTTQDQQSKASALVKIVRDSTERFKDVKVAEAEGYALQFGCVSGDDSGAMGLHYVNGDLVNSGVLDATRPQIVIYEAMPGGGLKLIGADYLVIADAWNASAFGSAGAHGTALSSVRQPQSLRAPGVLHAACLGVEGQSQGRVRELAPQRFVRVVRRPKPVSAAEARAQLTDQRFKHQKETNSMSTAQIPALDMNKLNAFIGQFVTDLGAAVHTGMVVIGEKLGLYKALAGEPDDFRATCRQDEDRRALSARVAVFTSRRRLHHLRCEERSSSA